MCPPWDRVYVLWSSVVWSEESSCRRDSVWCARVVVSFLWDAGAVWMSCGLTLRTLYTRQTKSRRRTPLPLLWGGRCHVLI